MRIDISSICLVFLIILLWQMISFIAYHRKMLYSMENLLDSYFLPMCQENKSESETMTGIQCFQLPQFVSNVYGNWNDAEDAYLEGVANQCGWILLHWGRSIWERVCVQATKIKKKKMLIRVIMEIKRLIKKWGWMRWVNGVKYHYSL